MSDIDALIDSVLSDEKLRHAKSCRDKVYSDEPLIKRGSQIKTPDIPQKITDMKTIAYSSEAHWKTSAWLFYTQGKFMEDFEDVYDYSEPLSNDMPSYNSLSSLQLRGYFSWRARVRNGLPAEGCLAFAYLLAFEMINGIGVKNNAEGFERLLWLQENFKNRQFDRRISRWIADHAVYYGLGERAFKKCTEFRFDEALIKLLNCDTADDEELYNAMLYIADRDISAFALSPENERYLCRAAAKIYRNYSQTYDRSHKTRLFMKFCNKKSGLSYVPFNSAIFYNRILNRESSVIVINELRSYSYCLGTWHCDAYERDDKKSVKMYDFLEAAAMLTEKHLGIAEHPTEKKSVPAAVKAAAKGIFESLDEELRLEELRNIKIDLSALSSIRADAEITRGRLMTEEDMAMDEDTQNDENDAENDIENVPENNTENAPEGSEALLTRDERELLCALLNGDTPKGNVSPSVLAESVNEKLTDIIGDVVIDFDGDVPRLIDDYADDLKELLEEGEI